MRRRKGLAGQDDQGRQPRGRTWSPSRCFGDDGTSFQTQTSVFLYFRKKGFVPTAATTTPFTCTSTSVVVKRAVQRAATDPVILEHLLECSANRYVINVNARVVHSAQVGGSVEGVDQVDGAKDATSTGVGMRLQFLQEDCHAVRGMLDATDAMFYYVHHGRTLCRLLSQTPRVRL